MDITFLGHSSFKIKGKSATLITDPFDPKMIGLKFTKVTADIVTVSHEHEDHNHLENIGEYKRIIKGPGEYEVMGVSILGFASYHDEKKGVERGKNTIFVYEIDEIRIAHLGDLGHTLSENLVEELGTIDILMVPVGGFYTIDAEKASEVVRAIEPTFVIPMHFQETGLVKEMYEKLTPVDEFVKQTGLSAEKIDKLTLKKIDIPEEGQKLFILEKK